MKTEQTRESFKKITEDVGFILKKVRGILAGMKEKEMDRTYVTVATAINTHIDSLHKWARKVANEFEDDADLFKKNRTKWAEQQAERLAKAIKKKRTRNAPKAKDSRVRR